MIGLTASPTEKAQSVLDVCLERWNRKKAEGSDDGKIPTCYRDSRVKDAIRAETYDKCAYCESKISATYWGDVEHILPKKHRPDLALDYDNLTLACAICNNGKGDYYDLENPLLNPYQSDPGSEIRFDGPILRQRLGSKQGKLTLLRLDLNRLPLVQRRMEKWNMLVRLADAIKVEPEGPLREELLREIKQHAASSNEYSAMAESILSVLEDELAE